MKMMIKLIRIISIVLLFVLLTSGCQTARRLTPDTDMKNDKRVEEKTPQERKITEINQDAIKGEAAADALVDMTGIDDAAVLFWNNKAIVAVILSESDEEKMSEELKEIIREKIKSFNPDVSDIDITLDKKIFYQLDDIQQSMIRGEQMTSLDKDINRIVNKIKNTK